MFWGAQGLVLSEVERAAIPAQDGFAVVTLQLSAACRKHLTRALCFVESLAPK
jgi:hypothetical protein